MVKKNVNLHMELGNNLFGLFLFVFLIFNLRAYKAQISI